MSNRVRYGSTRLLVEAVDREMENVRRAAMGNMALGPLNELRDLVAQLSERASRTAVDDLPDLPATEYVAKMKPIVADYHRALATNDLLAQCLCTDMRAGGCVLVLLGDDKTSVKAAHDPGKPGAEKAVGALLAALDDRTRWVADLAYWRDGARIVEAALAKARLADPADAPFPSTTHESRLWHQGRASAYQHALEMMAPPIGDQDGFAGVAGVPGPPAPPLDSLALETRPLTPEIIEQDARQTIGIADEPLPLEYVEAVLARDDECAHADTERGKDAPLRFGSRRTEVCRNCGAFRTHGHDTAQSHPSAWQPAEKYADATTDPGDDES